MRVRQRVRGPAEMRAGDTLVVEPPRESGAYPFPFYVAGEMYLVRPLWRVLAIAVGAWVLALFELAAATYDPMPAPSAPVDELELPDFSHTRNVSDFDLHPNDSAIRAVSMDVMRLAIERQAMAALDVRETSVPRTFAARLEALGGTLDSAADEYMAVERVTDDFGAALGEALRDTSDIPRTRTQE